MLYTIKYTKKNLFMSQSGTPRVKQYDSEGNLISDSSYVKPTVPNGYHNYVPPIDFNKKMYVVGMSQEELNKLVKEIGLYDDDGNKITEAPLRNLKAKFWKHKDVRLTLNLGGITLDDENPLDRLFLSCFKIDPYFEFQGDELPPSKKGKVSFTVMKFADKDAEANKEIDDKYNAILKLTKLEGNTDKMTSILRAMGTNVRDADATTLRNALYKKITDYANVYVPGNTGETNLELFHKLVDGDNKTLTIKSLITQAKGKGIILKQGNKYKYGDLDLGTSIIGVETFLTNSDNEDILNEIKSKVD